MAGDEEKEGDMITVCDLADDLRDAIAEYQVSSCARNCVPDSLLTVPAVFTTEGHLRTKL